MGKLETFVVAAKAACYVGNSEPSSPTRVGSHDLTYERGHYLYRDSYFGGTDFLGQETVWHKQETVWHKNEPVWAMNYYGRVLRADLIDGARAADVIRAALSAMYAEGRFLGGFDVLHQGFQYRDVSDGSIDSFTGIETIHFDNVPVYRLDYHGGVIVS
jgi:hypothetical protein